MNFFTNPVRYFVVLFSLIGICFIIGAIKGYPDSYAIISLILIGIIFVSFAIFPLIKKK